VSREFPPEEPEEEPPEPQGHIRTTGPGVLIGFGVTGLVLGWLLRTLLVATQGPSPRVGWLPVGALFFVAVIIGSVAWSTYVALHRRHERIEPHRAVNRLVLAKSCALAGALISGGYLGYAVSWMGTTSDAAGLQITQALLAALASVLIVAGSLGLERACRTDRSRD
jgi:hypothetical protein